MIPAEYKIVDDKYVGGYFLTPHDLYQLVLDFERDKQTNNMISLDTNVESYIEEWMREHNHIEK